MHLRNRLHNLLRWSETYTKTDMLYAAHGGFWLIAAKATGLVISLLLATAMANLISQETFGIYKFVLSGAAIISAFSLVGIGTAIAQAVSRGYEGSLKVGVREYLKWAFVVVGISLVTAIYYVLNGNYVLAASFTIVAICHPLLAAYSFAAQYTSGRRDFKTHSIFDVIRNGIPSLVLIATVFVTKDPVLIVLSYFLSSVVTTYMLYITTIYIFKPNDRIDPAMLKYSHHLSVLGMIGKIAEHIDKILIFHYLGAAQLATYAFALTPINNLKLLNDIPAKLAIPKLAVRSLTELRHTLPKKILVLMAIMSIIAGIYIVFAPMLFRILFPQYLDAIFLSQIAALMLVFLPGTMFGEALTAHMRKKELYVSQTILPITKVGLFLLLVPPFGVWGAIVTIVVSQFLTTVVQGIQFWRASRT